ncbi:Scr1 family TA system antitoxin-like transcriptional regulator [Embleya sp. MST-111070]|uniref:Scr1 family TA system antitoxin-like transcriptional regulator n=1 Tax=Embleya sp. MST-111070 TaxID=3398231 RepID=UPI003F735ADE
MRLEAGLKSSQVVKRLLWSPSKMTRLEAGENAVVEPADVMALCEIYAVDPETRALLTGYAAVTKTKRDWWQSAEYRPVIRPGFKAYLGLEATASALSVYMSEYVPGLLQTDAYVRVIYQGANPGLDANEFDRRVAARMTRQEVLRRREPPLKLTAIINEAVLRRVVGDRTVMRDQLTHIAEVAASHPHVRVQVLPFRVGAHPAMDGPFVILQFPEWATLGSIPGKPGQRMGQSTRGRRRTLRRRLHRSPRACSGAARVPGPDSESNQGALTPMTVIHNALTSGWFKSSYSNAQGGECVEVAQAHGQTMAIRDSKDPSRGAFLFGAHPWKAFLDSVKRQN